MKTILNALLYVTQLLHLRMGGQIEVSRDRITLICPNGRHWFATEKSIEEALKAQDKVVVVKTMKDEYCSECRI